MQSKTLVDIIQLECLTQSSVILRVTSAAGEGKLWIQKGEIVDAATGDLSGKEAFLEMLSWKAGNFEIVSSDLPRPRTIFESYEALLMETAQALDESNASASSTPVTGVASFSRFPGCSLRSRWKRGDPKQYRAVGVRRARGDGGLDSPHHAGAARTRRATCWPAN